jgi:hypothetical protein
MDHTIPVVVAPSSAATTSSSVIQVFMLNMVTDDQIAVPPGRDLSYEARREQQRDIVARGIVTQTRFTAQNRKCCISIGWRKPQTLNCPKLG